MYVTSLQREREALPGNSFAHLGIRKAISQECLPRRESLLADRNDVSEVIQDLGLSFKALPEERVEGLALSQVNAGDSDGQGGLLSRSEEDSHPTIVGEFSAVVKAGAR